MEESGSELCSPRELNRKKTSCGCIEVHVKSFLDSGPLVPCLTRLSSWSRKWCSRAAGHTQPEPTQVTPLPPSAGVCEKRTRKGATCPSKEPLPGPRMQVTFPNPLVPRMSAQWPRAPTAHTGSTPTLYSHTHSARGQEQHGPTYR